MTPDHGASGSGARPQTEMQRRRWYALAIMSIGAFMTPFDATIVAVALPKMGDALDLSYSEALWAQAAYLLDRQHPADPRRAGWRTPAAGGLQPAWGRPSSRSARWWPGWRPAACCMILGRCIQGAGGAFMFSTASGIITAAFPP